ncbi:ATP-binding protein [Kosakonia sp. YIM B13611]|uniref:ATP-binding protein n=1 Tax=unclassified Kosakonia TaxID=2632876 RepID=UPI0036AEEF8A
MSRITVKAGADFLTGLAHSKPVTALSELIWNGFDAKSEKVEVILNKDLAFGSIESILINDWGTGIDHNKVTDFFGNLGESWKKRAKADGDRSLHGQYGRGRFKSLSLGQQVHWKTVYEKNGIHYQYTISTDANRINDFTISDPLVVEDVRCGTQVEIINVSKNSDLLLSDEALDDVIMEFALFLTEYPRRKITFNGVSVSPMNAWSDKKDYDIGGVQLPDGSFANASLTVIEWNRKVQRELHYCDLLGFSLYKEALGNIVRAPGYDFTLYAKCDLFKTLSDKNEVSLVELVPEVKAVKDAIIQRARIHFIDKAFTEKSKVIDVWKAEDIYPYTDDCSADPTQVVERKVFDILAVNVQSYLKSFENADKKTKKFTFLLLSQAIKQNPSSVKKIITEVLGLKAKEQDELASLLERTTLSSIISASRIVSDRIDFLNGLDNLLHDRETKKSLLERDQLHKILEKEAWVFREDFFLAGSEDWLEEVLRKHIKHLGNRCDEDSSESVLLPDGRQGRVDLMFAKCRQPYEGYTEYLVVELKRPSQKINYDVIGQVEKYALSVSADERFDHSKSKWTFIAVSNSIDEHAERRAHQRGWPKGKTMDDAELNVEVWVLTWAEVLNAARAKLNFFSKQLNLEATRDDATSYLEKTHREFIPVIQPSTSESF